jgi:predicted acylesterase/phospholipase RssA
VLLPLLVATIAAAGTGEDARKDDAPVVIVVSGGISLGSYLAGQLYVFQEAVRSAPTPPRLVLAGASAGTVSAVVTALELHSHGTTQVDPEQSTLFRTWVGLGLHSGAGSLDAYGDDPASGKHNSWLFNETGIERVVEGLGHYGSEIVSPYPESIRVGAQTTRVEPLRDVVGARINEPFAFEFVPDAVLPFVLHRSQPLGGAPTRGRPFQMSELGSITRASGAFPIAFAPQRIACDAPIWGLKDTAYDPGVDCTRETETLLMDGGMFDNNPLALAKELTDNDPSTLYVFPDPDLAADLNGEPWQRSTPASAPSNDLERRSALVAQELSTFVRSARDQTLAAFVRDNTSRGILPVPQRTSPASTGLGGFLGFYDRSFRVWDFYAGMVDAHAFLSANAAALGLTHEHVEELRTKHRGGSPFGMIDRVFEAARSSESPVSAEALVAHQFDDVGAVENALDAAIDLHTVEWTGDGYAVLPWRPGASGDDLPDLRRELLENLRDLTHLALCRLAERNANLTCADAGVLAEGGDTGLRFLMRDGRSLYSPELAAAAGAAGLRNSDWLVWKIRFRNAWMAKHGFNQLVPASSLGFPTRQWTRSALFGSKANVAAYVGPLDGIGLLYRNQFRVSPIVGLETVARAEVSVVTGQLWPGADVGLTFPPIEPRTVGPLTFVHGGVGMSALVPVTGEQSFDGVRFVPYASLALAQVVWFRFAYTGQPITAGDITVEPEPFLSPGVELRAPFPLARRPRHSGRL